MQISRLFNEDAKHLKTLVALLTKEQASLVNMDIDAIEQILDEKGELLKTIADATNARHLVLGEAGFDANENGMVEWVRKDASATDRATWQTFQAELAQAKELNRVNGQMINQHFKRNQDTLNKLQGKPAETGVYGRNGQTTAATQSRGVLSV